MILPDKKPYYLHEAEIKEIRKYYCKTYNAADKKSRMLCPGKSDSVTSFYKQNMKNCQKKWQYYREH